MGTGNSDQCKGGVDDKLDLLYKPWEVLMCAITKDRFRNVRVIRLKTSRNCYVQIYQHISLLKSVV